jgi:3',5'-cyclic AMP phosphodiesterase CpdA
MSIQSLELRPTRARFRVDTVCLCRALGTLHLRYMPCLLHPSIEDVRTHERDVMVHAGQTSGRRLTRIVAPLASLLPNTCVFLLVALAGCAGGQGVDPLGPSPLPAETAVLVGAGDIGWCGLEGAEATATLLDAIPGIVFTAGDNAYFQGSREEFARCYHPAWGRHRPRTRPSPGNHDYDMPGAAGYFEYFGEAAAPWAPGYYSYDAGPWHVVSLNSNIPAGEGSPQLEWLRADLAAHRSTCSLAYFHHPLFSSGQHGPELHVRALWTVLYDQGVDVVVSGHDHIYERFAPQDPAGRPDGGRGIRQFIAGTGGAALTPVGAGRINSEARASVWGVLKLTLRATSYEWEFVPAAGYTFRDAGTGLCH